MTHKPIPRKKKVEKKKRFAGGSITDEVRRATGIGGETSQQKRERFFKSQGRDIEADPKGKQFETELRRSKGLKPLEEEGEGEGISKEELIKAKETIGLIEEAQRPDLIKITTTDELGVEKTLEVTPEQAALLGKGAVNEGLQARSEGRVPFNELPVYQQILAETAVLGVSPRAITKVARLGQIGKRGLPKTIKTTADTFASNPKSTAQTVKWLGGLGASVAAAFLIKDMMGTYPMAGFLKEEALQTLGFAFKSAKETGNIDGMEAALNLQFEALNPDLTDKILFAFPYLNVHTANKAFFEAARVKMNIDAKTFKDDLEKLEVR